MLFFSYSRDSVQSNYTILGYNTHWVIETNNIAFA